MFLDELDKHLTKKAKGISGAAEKVLTPLSKQRVCAAHGDGVRPNVLVASVTPAETSSVKAHVAGVARTRLRLDKGKSSRMPESGMTRLLTQQDAAVRDLFERRSRPFRAIAVVCDGKRPIWDAVRDRSKYDLAVKILDLHHATEHLSKAAEIIFEKGSDEATA